LYESLVANSKLKSSQLKLGPKIQYLAISNQARMDEEEGLFNEALRKLISKCDAEDVNVWSRIARLSRICNKIPLCRLACEETIHESFENGTFIPWNMLGDLIGVTFAMEDYTGCDILCEQTLRMDPRFVTAWLFKLFIKQRKQGVDWNNIALPDGAQDKLSQTELERIEESFRIAKLEISLKETCLISDPLQEIVLGDISDISDGLSRVLEQCREWVFDGKPNCVLKLSIKETSAKKKKEQEVEENQEVTKAGKLVVEKREKSRRNQTNPTKEDPWFTILKTIYVVETSDEDEEEKNARILAIFNQQLSDDCKGISLDDWMIDCKTKSRRTRHKTGSVIPVAVSFEERYALKSLFDLLPLENPVEIARLILRRCHKIPFHKNSVRELAPLLQEAFQIIFSFGIETLDIENSLDLAECILFHSEILFDGYLSDDDDENLLNMSIDLWRLNRSMLDEFPADIHLFYKLSARSQWLAAQFSILLTEQINEPTEYLSSCRQWVKQCGVLEITHILHNSTISEKSIDDRLKFASSRKTVLELKNRIAAITDSFYLEVCNLKIMDEVIARYKEGAYSWKDLVSLTPCKSTVWQILSKCSTALDRQNDFVDFLLHVFKREYDKIDASSLLFTTTQLLAAHVNRLKPHHLTVWLDMMKVATRYAFVVLDKESYLNNLQQIAFKMSPCPIDFQKSLQECLLVGAEVFQKDCFNDTSVQVLKVCSVVFNLLRGESPCTISILLSLHSNVSKYLSNSPKPNRELACTVLVQILAELLMVFIKDTTVQIQVSLIVIRNIIALLRELGLSHYDDTGEYLVEMLRASAVYLCSHSTINDAKSATVDLELERQELLVLLFDGLFGVFLGDGPEAGFFSSRSSLKIVKARDAIPPHDILKLFPTISKFEFGAVGLDTDTSYGDFLFRYLFNFMEQWYLYPKMLSDRLQAFICYSAVGYANNCGFGVHYDGILNILNGAQASMADNRLDRFPCDTISATEICQRLPLYYGELLKSKYPKMLPLYSKIKVESDPSDPIVSYENLLNLRSACFLTDLSYNPWRASSWETLALQNGLLLRSHLSSPESCNFLHQIYAYLETSERGPNDYALMDTILPSGGLLTAKSHLTDLKKKYFDPAINGLLHAIDIMQKEKECLDVPYRRLNRVLVKYEKGNWYNGTITRLNRDGTYDICYQDEFYDFAVSQEEIKAVTVQGLDAHEEVQHVTWQDLEECQVENLDSCLLSYHRSLADLMYTNLFWLKRVANSSYNAIETKCLELYEYLVIHDEDCKRYIWQYMVARIKEKQKDSSLEEVMRLYTAVLEKAPEENPKGAPNEVTKSNVLYRLTVVRYQFYLNTTDRQSVLDKYKFLEEGEVLMIPSGEPGKNQTVLNILQAFKHCAFKEGQESHRAIYQYARCILETHQHVEEEFVVEALQNMDYLLNCSYRESLSRYCVVFYIEYSLKYEHMEKPWFKAERIRYKYISLYTKLCLRRKDYDRLHQLLVNLVADPKRLKEDANIETLGQGISVVVDGLASLVQERVHSNSQLQEAFELFDAVSVFDRHYRSIEMLAKAEKVLKLVYDGQVESNSQLKSGLNFEEIKSVCEKQFPRNKAQRSRSRKSRASTGTDSLK